MSPVGDRPGDAEFLWEGLESLNDGNERVILIKGPVGFANVERVCHGEAPSLLIATMMQ